jgi:hypothetical protein
MRGLNREKKCLALYIFNNTEESTTKNDNFTLKYILL